MNQNVKRYLFFSMLHRARDLKAHGLDPVPLSWYLRGCRWMVRTIEAGPMDIKEWKGVSLMPGGKYVI